MDYGIWITGLTYCTEGFLDEERGNGRTSRLLFDSEEEAEDYARAMQRTTIDEAYFVTEYPIQGRMNEWRAEWLAARERVKTIGG